MDITESAITSNTGLDFGGALVCYMGIMDLDRVTIAGNSSNYGSAFNMREAAITISNSIVWENGENTVYSSSSSQASMMNIGYTNFYGGESYLSANASIILNWGDGNLDIDPLFCSVESNNFSLQEGSSCLIASATFGPIGSYSEGCGQILTIDHENIPIDYTLSQNYPNPFNPSTTINYTVHEAGLVDISVFSISGRWITELVCQYQIPGRYSVVWNGKDYLGNRVPSGLYFYRSVLNEKIKARKMILAK